MKHAACVNFKNHKPIVIENNEFVVVHNDIDEEKQDALDIPQKASLIMLNFPNVKWMQWAKANFPQANIALITDQGMHQYHRLLGVKNWELCDHIFHNNNFLTVKLINATVNKLVNKNIFGIKDYLGKDEKIFHLELSESSGRREVNDEVFKILTKSCGVHDQHAKNLKAICEELLTNAVYDAPISSGMFSPEEHGKEISFNDKKVKITLGIDANQILLSVEDPFGSFTKSVFFHYIQKILKHRQKEDLLDHKIGGAGVGLLKILFYSQAMTVSVHHNQRTEVTAILDRKNPAPNFDKFPRSFSYFYKE